MQEGRTLLLFAAIVRSIFIGASLLVSTLG
jgi:hypothetical protein